MAFLDIGMARMNIARSPRHVCIPYRVIHVCVGYRFNGTWVLGITPAHSTEALFGRTRYQNTMNNWPGILLSRHIAKKRPGAINSYVTAHLRMIVEKSSMRTPELSSGKVPTQRRFNPPPPLPAKFFANF